MSIPSQLLEPVFVGGIPGKLLSGLISPPSTPSLGHSGLFSTLRALKSSNFAYFGLHVVDSGYRGPPALGTVKNGPIGY